MDTATLVMILAGVFLTVFAAAAVLSTVYTASKVKDPEQVEGEAGPSFQRRLAILNED